MKHIFTESFKKQYKKLPENIRMLFLEKLKLFLENPKHPSLRVHKLQGKLCFFFSLSINMNYRAKFSIQDDYVKFFEIGTHDKVYK